MNRKSLFLLLVIFLEGYVVLSTELLAIRSTLPYVGSGTDTLSIIIAAVLMPLAFGYYSGGRFRTSREETGVWATPRRRLLQNFMISTIILTLGLSYVSVDIFFELMQRAFGLQDRVVLTTVYSVLFLAAPVYLLGQTIPLISNFFPRENLAALAGRILFISTLGSFMGAVFCTLILMTFLGVHYTVMVTIGCLVALTLLMSKRYLKREPLVVIACFLVAIFLNSQLMLENQHVVANNRYNMIAVFEQDNGNRHLMLNKNFSSMVGPEGGKHPYIAFAERLFMNPLLPEYGNRRPRDILVVGAGGFTFGLDDNFNEYDYLDIDGSLKEISEKYFLQRKLGENKMFHPVPVRAYLNSSDKKYDLIFLDAYYGHMTIPEHLVTREFFQQAKDALKEDGILIANFILSPNLGDAFSRNLDNTLRSVFPYLTREALHDYDGWNMSPSHKMNILYVYHNEHADAPHSIYTDDKSRMFLDRPREAN